MPQVNYEAQVRTQVRAQVKQVWEGVTERGGKGGRQVDHLKEVTGEKGGKDEE